MPYDIRRLGGFAAALLAVVVGMACYGLVLQATLGRTGPWITLRGQTFNVASAPTSSIMRVLGIKRDLNSGVHVVPGERLGVLVGASTLRQGIDPAVVEADVDQGYRWTSIFTAAPPPRDRGGGPRDVPRRRGAQSHGPGEQPRGLGG